MEERESAKLREAKEEDPSRAANLEKENAIKRAVSLLSGKRVLSSKALKSKLKDIQRKKRSNERKWIQKQEGERRAKIRQLQQIQQDIMKRGDNKAAKKIERQLETVKDDPTVPIVRPRGVRKTLRRVEKRRRIKMKERQKDSRKAKRLGVKDSGLDLAKPGEKKQRKKTPRRSYGRRITSFKVRRAIQGGTSSRGKGYLRRMKSRRR